jgi:NADPH2:quinone reductase
MRHVRFHARGGPEVLVVEETDPPRPAAGQVLIRTEAIGVNYVDVQIRRDAAPGSIYFRPLPGTLTGDVVGIVEQVGPGADPSLLGQRVAVLLEDGCADYVLADTAWLVRVPAGLEAGAATMLPMVGAVGLGALRSGRLAPGETVLVTAAAGAIGHLAIQLARLRGAGTVIGLAGSAAKLGFIAELGADAAIDYSQPGWPDQVRAAAPGGIDVALEAVGGSTLEAVIGLLAPLGRAVVFGASAGDFFNVPVRSLFGLKSVTGFSLLAWRAINEKQARADIDEVAELLVSGRLRAGTDTRLPLADVAKAHQLLEDRSVTGRIILLP